MIRINDDYYIDIDEYNYTLKQDLHKKRKDGTDYYKVCGYYTSLKSAILALKELKVKDLLSNGEYTLEQALYEVTQASKEFETLLTKVMEERG